MDVPTPATTKPDRKSAAKAFAASSRPPPWTYDCRREMQQILPGLFLGPYAAARKTQLASLEAKGITHVVCVRQDNERSVIKPNFEGHFKYLVVDMLDSQGSIRRHYNWL